MHFRRYGTFRSRLRLNFFKPSSVGRNALAIHRHILLPVILSFFCVFHLFRSSSGSPCVFDCGLIVYTQSNIVPKFLYIRKET